jgi:hypothetical protein
MNYFAEKILGLILCTVFGFTLATSVPEASGGPSSTTPIAREYWVEPSTTTTSSTLYIDPYASSCEQLSALAVNLGWPLDQRTVLESVMARESNCTPNSVNSKDPFGGSYGLLQINWGGWQKWLTTKGLITDKQSLLDPATNLLAGLAIYNYGVERYGFGWGPWSTK